MSIFKPIVPIFTQNSREVCQVVEPLRGNNFGYNQKNEYNLNFLFCVGFFQKLYERTKIGYILVFGLYLFLWIFLFEIFYYLLIFVYIGWFPVKLRTIVGDPIYYDQYKSMSNEEVVSLVNFS